MLKPGFLTKAALLTTLFVLTACESASKYVKFGPISSPLRWSGFGQDLVGDWDNGNPDGRRDGVFTLTLDQSAQSGISSILVYSSDQNGNAGGGQYWHSSDTRRFVLGVVANGRQLNHKHVPSLGAFDPSATLELHCNDTGYFRPGQWFTVEIAYQDGSRGRASVRL